MASPCSTDPDHPPHAGGMEVLILLLIRESCLCRTQGGGMMAEPLIQM